MWLLHGTTLARAEQIILRGPDVDYIEPGGFGTAENFSFTAEGTQSALGDSVTYAQGKSLAFPNEHGPAIVAVNVPEEIVRAAVLEHLSLFADLIEYDEHDELDELVALCGGVVQFDSGSALDDLLAQWAALKKEIRGVP